MITNESLIELHVKSKNKKEILRSLARRAGELGRIRDAAGYMQSIMEREELFPTVIGYGIAIPYGESSFVQKPFLAFANSSEPFRWDSRSELEARLIFLIGVPKENAADLHLKILANICRGLRNEYYWERLAQTTDASEVMAIFGKWGFRGEKINNNVVGDYVVGDNAKKHTSKTVIVNLPSALKNQAIQDAKSIFKK